MKTTLILRRSAAALAAALLCVAFIAPVQAQRVSLADLQAQITALQGQVNAQQAQINALQADLVSARAELDFIKGNSVLALDGVLTFDAVN